MLASPIVDRPGLASFQTKREPGSNLFEGGTGGGAKAAPATMRPDSEIGRPAVNVTLSTSTRVESTRLLIYGRPGSGAGNAQAASSQTLDTDPGRMLDRKMAEGRKEVAAIQIRQTKAAAKDAGVLSLLDPAGAIGIAKNAAKTLSSAMRSFGDAEKSIRRTEDDSLAAMAPEEVTAIAYDVYEKTSVLGVTEDGRHAVDAALARLRDGRADGPTGDDDPSDRVASATLTASMRIEALSVVRLEDKSNIADRAAEIGQGRSERMGVDADVIKDGISGLRYLDQLIHRSIQRLQETGRMDARAAGEAAEARAAWHDALAATTLAAMPVVQAGYSITPSDDT